MKKIIRTFAVCIAVALMVLSSGCKKETVDANGKIYYVNADKAGIAAVDYDFTSSDTDGRIEEALAQLAEDVDDIDVINTIPSGVEVKKWDLNEGSLNLYLVGDYSALDTYTEILVRAAIVKTLAQIDGVDSISIFINDSPLADSNGESVGSMTAETFIDDFGQETDSLLSTDLTLYFASANGMYTVSETRKVYYSRNVAIEKLVMDQLLKGPETDGLLSAIPSGTKVNSISISEDGVCVVNLDVAIETAVTGVTENVTVYSIVNSLTELDNVKQVQILVNGEAPHISNLDVDLSAPISRNEEIINAVEIEDDETDYSDEEPVLDENGNEIVEQE